MDWKNLINHKSGKSPAAILHGKKVVVAHGHKSGALPELNNPEVLDAIERGYKVACCHPQQVQSRYGIETVGDWKGESEVYFADDDGNIATSPEQAKHLVVRPA